MLWFAACSSWAKQIVTWASHGHEAATLVRMGCNVYIACLLQLEVSASTADDLSAWNGWVHSRLRLLVRQLEAEQLCIRPWPDSIDNPALEGEKHVRNYFMCLTKRSADVSMRAPCNDVFDTGCSNVVVSNSDETCSGSAPANQLAALLSMPSWCLAV